MHRFHFIFDSFSIGGPTKCSEIMYSSKLSIDTQTLCTNGSNLRPLELANSTKVSSVFRLAFFLQLLRCSNVSVGIKLGRRLKSLVKAESAVGNLLMWLVATVSISTETIKSVCSCLVTLALVKLFSGSGS